jgi:hypothetical protein
MALKTINESILTAIGNAIRAKLGVATTYKPSEMAAAIGNIQTPNLDTLEVNENGTYTPTSPKNGFSQVDVNVPNSYAAGDEGKVVSEGALVAQTSKNINANGTHDTTTNNQVVVDVPIVTPTGNINITDTQITDVSAYATAQVVDADLVAENIKKDVNILGVVGSYEGSGGGGGLDFNCTPYCYLGTYAADAKTSLSATISDLSGKFAVVIITRRDSVTLTSGWTLVEDRLYSNGQYNSIYTKTLASNSESLTITQASSVRMSASIWIFDVPVTFTFKERHGTDIFTVPIDLGSQVTNNFAGAKMNVKGSRLLVCHSYGQPTSNYLEPFHIGCVPCLRTVNPRHNYYESALRHLTAVVFANAQNPLNVVLGELYSATLSSSNTDIKVDEYEITPAS